MHLKKHTSSPVHGHGIQLSDKKLLSYGMNGSITISLMTLNTGLSHINLKSKNLGYPRQVCQASFSRSPPLFYLPIRLQVMTADLKSCQLAREDSACYAGQVQHLSNINASSKTGTYVGTSHSAQFLDIH